MVISSVTESKEQKRKKYHENSKQQKLISRDCVHFTSMLIMALIQIPWPMEELKITEQIQDQGSDLPVGS